MSMTQSILYPILMYIQNHTTGKLDQRGKKSVSNQERLAASLDKDGLLWKYTGRIQQAIPAPLMDKQIIQRRYKGLPVISSLPVIRLQVSL